MSADLSLLDNPIYNALGTDQAGLALTSGQARRFPGYIGPLAGIPDQSAQSFADLRQLADDGHTIALFLVNPPIIPADWTLIRGALMDQMVCLQPSAQPRQPLQDAVMRQLTPCDAPAMVALAKLTEPGPFHLRTIELGVFYGIFHGSSLLAWPASASVRLDSSKSAPYVRTPMRAAAATLLCSCPPSWPRSLLAAKRPCSTRSPAMQPP